MNKIIPKIVSALVLCIGFTAVQADNVKIVLKTSKSTGSGITLKVPKNVLVSVDWGNGEAEAYHSRVITGNVKGETITITGGSNFTGFDCHGQDITSIDISKAAGLITLNCSDNQISKLALPSSALLEELDCSNNSISSLSMSNASSLRYLDCSGNSLSSVNIIGNANLEVLNISDNAFTSVSVKSKNNLRSLWADNNKLSTLTFSASAPIQSVMSTGNSLLALSLSNRDNIQDLWIGGCKLARYIDLSDCSSLKTLDVSNAGLDSISISKKINARSPLQYFNCSDNHLSMRNFLGPSYVKTYVCGNQTEVNVAVKDTVKAGEPVDFSRFSLNSVTARVGTISFHNGLDDTELKKGSSASTGDYMSIGATARSKFFKVFPSVYLKAVSTYYPNLVITTKKFAVWDAELALGIGDVKQNNSISTAVDGNVLTLSSAKAQDASVVSTDGVVMWQGKVSPTPVEISLAPGIYIVGQKKIVIK